MQEDASGRHLLQPLAAGVPAALLVLAVVVVAVAQGRQQLLGEGAHGGHQRLAEDAVPPQLQLRVCGHRGQGRAGRGAPAPSAGLYPTTRGPGPASSPRRDHPSGANLADSVNSSQAPKATPQNSALQKQANLWKNSTLSMTHLPM